VSRFLSADATPQRGRRRRARAGGVAGESSAVEFCAVRDRLLSRRSGVIGVDMDSIVLTGDRGGGQGETTVSKRHMRQTEWDRVRAKQATRVYGSS